MQFDSGFIEFKVKMMHQMGCLYYGGMGVTRARRKFRSRAIN